MKYILKILFLPLYVIAELFKSRRGGNLMANACVKTAKTMLLLRDAIEATVSTVSSAKKKGEAVHDIYLCTSHKQIDLLEDYDG